MQLFDSRTARILTTVCIFIAVAAFLYGIRDTLVLFLFAIFFGYLLDPLVTRIQIFTAGAAFASDWPSPKPILLLGGGLGLLMFFFGPQLEKDTRSLLQSLPNLLENVTSGKIVWQFGSKHGWSDRNTVAH